MLDSIGITDKFTDAELHAFLQWSQQSDPTQKLRVLEVAFDNPDAAFRLARRAAFTMNACIGLSPERRSRVLAMLLEPPKMGSMDTVFELRGLASRFP